MTSLDEIVESLKVRAVAILKGDIDKGVLSNALNTLANRPLTLSASDFLGEPNSLTPRNWLSYGRESYDLPLHTDYPDYEVPPRFVLLKCHTVGKFPIETIFYDVGKEALTHPELQTLLNEPWLTTGGIEKSRVIRLLEVDSNNGVPLLRYASNVMRPFFPTSSSGRRILTEIVNATCPIRIVLLPGDIVLWDNWRVLHGRQIASATPGAWQVGTERVLERLKWT